jgi:nitrate reductase NapE
VSTTRKAPPDANPENPPATRAPSTKQEEFRSFLFFTIVMAPVLAVMLVGGYGFLVWVYQMVAGPPGS